MYARSPSSFVVSLTIHLLVAAFIFVTTVYVSQQEKPPVIFELVAGPPTAPDELVAPAEGNSSKPIKLEVPKVDVPPQKIEPPPQETSSTNEPEVKEEITPKPKPAAKTPLKPAPAKPKIDTSIAKEMKKSARVSYQDYLKKHPAPKVAAVTSSHRPVNVPRIDAQGIANGVRDGSTANTRGGGGEKKLTREEQSELNTYISFLLSALKEAHEPPPGVSDQLEAKVTFDITAGGSILNPRISKSSGDKSFDDSVIEAFRRVKSIGPTPDGKADTWTVTFRMKDTG
ncbi:MAG TPA: TonB family protein [Lacunisphaera sp.]|jgi:colicin import membrane protein